MNLIYTVDWGLIFRRVLPGFSALPLILHYLDVVAGELRSLYEEFIADMVKWRYQVAHTAQTLHIEKVLNDAFDEVERRIYIENVTFEEYVYLWPPEDENPHYLQQAGADPDNPLYLLEGDPGTLNPDATIYVPVALKPTVAIELENFEAKMRGLVDFYKTFGPNYQILYY